MYPIKWPTSSIATPAPFINERIDPAIMEMQLE
jgi:hypothetical protein